MTSDPTTEDPDAELAARFAAGEPDAVRGLYARWAGPVYTVAISRLGDRELAEEAVQETFVKAWQAAHTLDARRGVGPWLYTIARRTAMDIARRERRRPSTTALRESDQAAETTPFSWAWERWEVRCALRDLGSDERELLRLTHYVGFSQSEIARRLGLPIGTVKSRIHRAHRRLAERLGHLRVTL